MDSVGELNAVSQQVIGAAIEVHRHLGPGFCEAVYESALVHELGVRSVAYDRQVPVRVNYKGQLVGEGRIDLLVAGELIVELKSVESLAQIHRAQLLSYLRATGKRLGLLMNFNVEVLHLGVRRVVLT